MQCYPVVGGCQGSANANCNPNAFWASTLRSSSNYEHAWLSAGTLYTAGGSSSLMTYPFSVRCVLDLSINEGLQLCDASTSSSYGATQCYWLSGGCQGSYGTNCHPFDLWSGTIDHEGYYKLGQLISGTWRINTYASTYAFSVRCVLDLILYSVSFAGYTLWFTLFNIYRQMVYSSAIEMGVLLTVLYSVPG